jgi:hypothetical protein
MLALIKFIIRCLKLRGVILGLCYLHGKGVAHGNLRGVMAFSFRVTFHNADTILILRRTYLLIHSTNIVSLISVPWSSTIPPCERS